MTNNTNDKSSTINEEERKSKLDTLRAHLMQGAEQAKSGQFIDDFSMDVLINDLDNEPNTYPQI